MTIDDLPPLFDLSCKELFILTTRDVTGRMLADYERNGFDCLIHKDIVLIKR